MKYELEVISDIVSRDNKIVKKNVVYKKVFELDEVEVEQYLSTKGLLVKRYCTIICKDKFYKVNSPYENVRRLVTPTEVSGFYSKTSRYEKEQRRKKKL